MSMVTGARISSFLFWVLAVVAGVRGRPEWVIAVCIGAALLTDIGGTLREIRDRLPPAPRR